MARRALAASFVIAPFAAALAMQGCTQDFSTFDPTGAGGNEPSTTSTTTTTTTTTSSTGSTTTTNVGPGGGEGGAPGTGGFGGGGAPPECEVAADCDDDNVCTDDACVDTECVRTPVGDGPRDGDDETDCMDESCEGGELVKSIDDSEDPPDTSPPCDVSNCVDGEPTRVLAGPETTCGNPPLACDGAGVCTGCDGSPANECGAGTLCSAPSCNVAEGTCQSNFTATDPADPTDGDCRALDCPGNQADPDTVNDNNDVPADLACSDRGCAAGAITAPVRGEGTACLAGATGVCDGVGTDVTACKDCRDTALGTADDAGCGGADPSICDEAANSNEGVCRDCIDDAPAGGTDTGCDAGSPVCDETANSGDGACVSCADTGAGTDPGCLVAEPVCDEGNDTCVTCLDAGAGVTDEGCADQTPACDEAGGTTGACEECQDDADCAGQPEGDDCRINGNTECGCDNSNDCVGSPIGDICLGNGSCGCANNGDCNHGGAAGPTCTAGVCQ